MKFFLIPGRFELMVKYIVMSINIVFGIIHTIPDLLSPMLCFMVEVTFSDKTKQLFR